MADTIKVLSLAGLQKYDGLIKTYIGDEDAKSIKYARLADGVLKLYKAENPASDATPDFSLTLPTQDLSGLMEKVSGATNGHVATLNSSGEAQDSGTALSDLETTAHAGAIPNGATATTIVGYAAEVAGAAQTAAETNSAVTISQDGLVVTFKQGGSTSEDIIGTINIPADMVVSSGEVVTYTAQTLPSGTGAPTEAGTYLVLTLANASGQKVYINVADLIDTYTAAQNASQVQLAVNGRVLSASIVAGGVTSTELASDAVTTAKIVDANVTAAKLASDAVETAKIKDANVTAAKLATDSVTTAKIVDANVTTAKIADANVTADKLASNAVTTAKITDANVTAAKLATDAVETAKIKDANVTAAKLASDSVTTAKIVDSNVTKAKLASTVQASLDLADSAVQPEDIAVITDAEIEALFPSA